MGNGNLAHWKKIQLLLQESVKMAIETLKVGQDSKDFIKIFLDTANIEDEPKKLYENEENKNLNLFMLRKMMTD